MHKIQQKPLDPPAPHNSGSVVPCGDEGVPSGGRSLYVNGVENTKTDNYTKVISDTPGVERADPPMAMGRMMLPVAADGALATASDAFLLPAEVPPKPEVRELGIPRPRSPLRNGTALDGLVPNRPLFNSLLERSALCRVDPPIAPSTSFARCSRFESLLKKATEKVIRSDTFELTTVARIAIAKFHQPKVKEISDRPLPNHMPSDPIDPVVIFIEAIPLAYRVLHHDPSGNHGLDLDGVAYIVERLGEAERLRAQEQDIRFEVLQALSALLVAIIEKAKEGGVACVKAA